MPDAITGPLQAYLDGLVPPRHPELVAMEEYARARGFPIIGPACGHLCYQIARLTGARRVFELGSGYGYSTAWFARAVRENGGGEVHHTVWDEALSRQAQGHLGALGLAELVRFHVAEAVSTLSQTTGPFDLIFSDIDKEGYPASLPVIEARLRTGGVLIVDNLLWGNRVLDADQTDPATEGVRGLTRLVTQSPAWVSSVLPIRDGLLLALRLG
ncbi:MAG: O-methyltransferase [Chromatiaceae bacterium]|jgi:predicted O-methyltransferase YrrM|nr:O-methyltransferase [Chromatiaceae bacterium]